MCIMQEAAERMRAVVAQGEAAQADAEAKGEQAAALRRQVAELSGRLSVAEDEQVRPACMCPHDGLHRSS